MKALVLLSGGVDSATSLAMLCKEHGAENVVALSISYGQKHEKELLASERLAEYYGVEHLYLDLTPIFQYSNCSLLSHSDQEIPQEDYATQLDGQEGKPVTTYVPFRNGLFLSVAASVALSKGCEIVNYGAHRDDAAGQAYPDCSQEFYDAMNAAIVEGSGGQARLEAPFVGMTKAEVVKIGLKLHVPYQMTWSCYEGGEKPCGHCATCIDRAKAFAANGVKDPAL
ncbi:MAG: 7-cyano-7-deazaguanine synthase QueC [Lachnospiraceae bacterium]|nr:7-cyano-7-deazaguanine synthase QueC [Lachnospiraceae bacterium]